MAQGRSEKIVGEETKKRESVAIKDGAVREKSGEEKRKERG